MATIDTNAAEQIASAVREGDADAVRLLFDKYPECLSFLDLPDALTGPEISHWSDYAKHHGQDSLASMLLFDFPDPTLRGIYGAIDQGDVQKLRQLLEDHPRYVRGRPAQLDKMLIQAARDDRINVVEMLLRMGGNINARRFKSDTALDLAVSFASPDMVEYLLSHGADANNEADRPLIGAISRDPEELALRLVQLLVERGADVNREYTVFGDNNNTFTALEWAEGKPKIIEYLRSKGAVERRRKLPERTVPDTLAEEVVGYFEEHFGPAKSEAQIEIVPSGPPIAIHLISPTVDRKYATLFTTGMSDQPMRVPEGTDDFRFAELYIELSGDWPTDKKSMSKLKYGWPINWLRLIANYPHQQNTWLGGPVTIIANGEPPEPLAPGLKFTSLLVMADRNFTSQDGRTVYLYRVLPLYTEERNLEIKKGIAALMRALDKHDIPSVVDLNRANVGLAK